MKFMVGNDWMDLFEVVVVRARKPKFFNEASRYFLNFQTTLQDFIIPSVEENRKPVFRVSDKVRHNSGCTTTEDV